MRILVYPHDLGLGGSQLNAIDLAAAAAETGHEVCVYGDPGPLVDRVRSKGLEFVASPSPRRRPSSAVVRHLRATLRERRVDVVHGYEWPPVLEATLACVGTTARPFATVMSMAVADFLPRTVDLVVGTERIAAVERSRGRRRVDVLEPPVDLRENVRDTASGVAFRRRWGIGRDATLVVSVARLAHELKLEGTLVAIDVVADLAATTDVVLALVGDGPARAEVDRRVAAANARAGRRVVVTTGALTDPRPGYAAADIALGMGGSALRAMAFRTPVVVQGERGFWRTLTPESVDGFLWEGWYGVGRSPDDGARYLRAELGPLLDDARRRAELGAFAASVVAERFSLEAAVRRQVALYTRTLERATTVSGAIPDGARSATLFGEYEVRRQWNRRRGRAAVDDFNTVGIDDSNTVGIDDSNTVADPRPVRA
ncbi:glycosyltransferase [Rhodococcoides corynebacterioides]|uniref:Glycosyltransferase n=1 Tax=Rhodococcoides corynebacterioides TaxID=53972 RepID=A0ABS7P5C4_9NOCA|nr:glycosyltransferase [Rhodococcus corynebacterioides]MBY6367520.1 glycosyltransferase [Rhodococcus corynebacterioides]MBY6407212.1 glycosyltransferase [Rhodococcus corynebacterioides]